MMIILIPAYEPTDTLIKLVSSIDSNKYDIVIVNDGSSKHYDNIFNKCKPYAKVISYKENKCKGYALKTGLQYIKEKYIDNYIVCTMDSDGQHKIKDAYNLMSYVKNNPDAYVLGKRMRGDNTPLRSRIGNSITRQVYKFITKLDIYDTQTGLRAFSSKLVNLLLSIEGNRFDYEMNALLSISKLNIPIKEIKIDTIYIDNNTHSHFKTIRDSYLIYKNIIKFTLASISSFIIDYLLFIIFSLIFTVTLSNILARIVSATFNFIVNYKVVFKSKKSKVKSLLSYIVLALLILILNTILINIFINIIGINRYISKFIVEIILFIFSYYVQSKLIFKEG